MGLNDRHVADGNGSRRHAAKARAPEVARIHDNWQNQYIKSPVENFKARRCFMWVGLQP